MTLKSQIEKASGDPAALERLYREALAAESEAAFKEAITECAAQHPGGVLFSAWVLRLNDQVPPPGAASVDLSLSRSQTTRWAKAIATGVVFGILFALFAQGKPPVPIPWEADPLFWLGWGPLTALGILSYGALIGPSRKRSYRYAIAAVALLSIAALTAVTVWNRTDDIAILSTIHMPFVAWAAVGAALILEYPDPARQGYAYVVKSVETLVAGGLFFAAGAMFMGLTLGILAVLGINIPEENMLTIGALGMGAIPVLALASVYDPTAAPMAQDWASGLTRLLRILMQLILPLALVVLIAYMFWFVPAYFWRPFQEREVLIVYNVTIMAILALLTLAVSGPVDERLPRHDAILRYAVLALGGLMFLLNVYALAAIASRTIELGITPNRYAVLGWNLTTLLMLAVIGIRQWRGRFEPWVTILRESIARALVLSAAWALWVLIGVPLAFD